MNDGRKWLNLRRYTLSMGTLAVVSAVVALTVAPTYGLVLLALSVMGASTGAFLWWRVGPVAPIGPPRPDEDVDPRKTEDGSE